MKLTAQDSGLDWTGPELIGTNLTGPKKFTKKWTLLDQTGHQIGLYHSVLPLDWIGLDWTQD